MVDFNGRLMVVVIVFAVVVVVVVVTVVVVIVGMVIGAYQEWEISKFMNLSICVAG